MVYKKRLLSRLDEIYKAGQLTSDILDTLLLQLVICDEPQIVLKIKAYWDIQDKIRSEYEPKILEFNKNVVTLVTDLLANK